MFIYKYISDLENNKPLVIRAAFILVILTVILINSLTGFAVTAEVTDCIYDHSHIMLDGLKLFFQENPKWKSFSMIVIGLILDLSFIVVANEWLKRGESWSSLVIVIKFLFMKCVCSLIFPMKYSDDHLWEDPGFPSLLISYNKSNDFFFSGSVGFSLILAVNLHYLAKEQSDMFKSVLSKLSFANIIFQFFIYLSIRANYLIDILMGVVFAHYCMVTCEGDFITIYLDNNFPLLIEETKRDLDMTSELVETNPVTNKKTISKSKLMSNLIPLGGYSASSDYSSSI